VAGRLLPNRGLAGAGLHEHETCTWARMRVRMRLCVVSAGGWNQALRA
jgi:hypothetical protein